MDSEVSDESVRYLRQAARIWEILRIPYTAAALAGLFFVVWLLGGMPEAIFTAFLEMISSPVWWCILSAFCLLANVLYCAGPLLECGLFAFFGIRLGRYRYAMWAAGTAIAAVLAFPCGFSALTFFLSGGLTRG